MAGLFKIHPSEESTITLDTLDTVGSSPYLLVDQNLKEREREKIIYSEGKFDGSVINSKASIIDIEFTILTGGSTPEEASVNASNIAKAFSNVRGVLIEYRPVGYDGAIITTFYRYLKSGPPERLSADSAYQSPNDSYALGKLYLFTVKIFSLAISNPDDIHDTIASGTVFSYTDAAELGYLALNSSAIKGDGLLPMISVEGISVALGIDEFIISFFEVDSGKEDEDWYTGQGGSTAGVIFDTTDRYHPTSPLSTWFTRFVSFPTTKKAMGRCVPLITYKLENDIDEWQIRMIYTSGFTSENITLTDWQDLPIPSGVWNLAILDSIGIPPFYVAEIIDVSLIGGQMGIEVREKNGTAGTLKIYGLLAPKVEGNAWIAKFSSSLTGDTLIEDYGFSVNCPAGMSYRWIFSASNGIWHMWDKQGMPVIDGIMPKGHYQIRYLGKFNGEWSHFTAADNKVAMIISGLFYTIYPFAES